MPRPVSATVTVKRLQNLVWIGMRPSNYPEQLVRGGLLLPGLGQLAFKTLHRTIARDCRHFGRHDGSILDCLASAHKSS